jgi:uncharacterized protein (DUF427 family)
MAPGFNHDDVFQPPEGVYYEPTARRIRAMLGGHIVFDTTGALLVWEHRFHPHYYIPVDDVAPGALAATGSTSEHERLGIADHYTVRIGRVCAADAASTYTTAPVDELRTMVRFDWDAMDAWFEEDNEVYVHARSPYTRVDVLDSSRHVRVDIDGVTVAASSRPRILFETGIAPRYYLPKTDVRFELLFPSDLATSCPYKGTANYWSVNIDNTEYQNVAWSYDAPRPESSGVAGLVCFYNDRVNLFLDGRPV